MSTLLPTTDMSGMLVGTTFTVPIQNTGITAYPGNIKNPPYVQIFNESGNGLVGETVLEGDSFFVPAGGWKEVALFPGESGIQFTVIYQLPSPPVSTLVIAYYEPGENRDTVGVLGNSPTQGTQTTSTAGGAAFQLNGSAVADATLPNACDFSVAVGGVEVAKLTTVSGGAGTICEVTSQGKTIAALSTIPTTSITGNGWAFTPGAGSFAAAPWSALTNLSFAALAVGATATIQFWRYSGGVVNLIGSIATNISGIGKAVRTWTATSLPLATFAAGDILYVAIFIKNNGSSAIGVNPTVYESTTTANGVVNDMQVITPKFG